jgi:hypothetical protein
MMARSTTAKPVAGARAVAVRFDEALIHVRLEGGREIGAPLVWFPRLAAATSEQRQHWQLIGHGVGLHWPDLDEDLSVAGFLGT